MTRFIDGPAKSHTLFLKRAPIFLRVVTDSTGEWDALDQLTDTPRFGEKIFVYQLVSGRTRVHLQRRVKGRRVCGFYEGGEYRFVVDQPADEILRARESWEAWETAEPIEK